MKENRKTKYTQMVLQDALMELMAEKSISKITIKELCEKADINRTTFYAHYTDQNDLLHEIEANVLLSEFYSIFVLNGSIGLIQHWLKSGLTKSVNDMSEIIFNMAAQIK